MDRAWLRRLLPAAAFQLCFVGAISLLKPGANALVLSHFTAHALPWLYVAASALTAGLAAWTASRPRRRSPGPMALLGGVAVAAFAVGVGLEWPAVALVAYVTAEALATHVALAFWGVVPDAFDAREARRAFSWINGLGMGGAILGGFAAQVLARTAGAVALLAGAAVLLVGAAVAFRFHRSTLEPVPRAPPPGPSGWRTVTRLPYARLLAGVVLSLSLLTALTDFVFRHRAGDALNEAQLADLFGANQLWTGVFAVGFQLVLAELLLRRLGLLRYVALVPGLLGALAIGALVWPSVWATWGLKLFENAASFSLMPVALQLLYAPLPDDVRDGVRRTVDGLVRKGGLGVAGVFLILAAGWLDVTGLLVLVVALSVLVGVLLWRLHPGYVEAVHHRVAGTQAGSVGQDEVGLLHEALSAPSAERALRAADLLEHAELLGEEGVRRLLRHKDERVLERGVHAAEALRVTSVTRELEALMVTASRRPRDAAIWALGKLNPARAQVILPTLLSSTDVGVLCAAVGGLLRAPDRRQAQEGHAGPERRKPSPHPRAAAVLEALLARGDRAPVPERREVARLLGRLKRPDLVERLNQALEDPDGSVRKVAITAVGTGGYVQLAPRLLRFLVWRDERRAAREALARLGDGVVPLLRAALDDRQRPLSLRLQLPRVLRRVGTQPALEALLYSNAQDEPALHYRVGVAVSRIKEEHPELVVDRARVLEALARRRAVHERLSPVFADLRAGLGDAALATRVVGDRLDQALELSFWLLGLLHGPVALRRAHALLLSGDARRRAWALELIDTTLEAEERAFIAPWLRAHHRKLGVGNAAGVERWLLTLGDEDDVLVRACARRAAAARGIVAPAGGEDDMNEVTVQRLFALEGVEIFAQSDVDDVAAVASVARERTFKAGERVYSEGDPGDALYVVVEGSLQAVRAGEIVFTMKARESFGETSLFDGAPRVNEVVAVSDARCLVIDRRDFLDLLADRPELLAGMFRVLSKQLKSVVVELAHRRVTHDDLPAV